jgi:protein gp37
MKVKLSSVCGLVLVKKKKPKVWFGVSVESQEWLEERMKWFLSRPATLRFLSVEPMLGPLDLRPYLGQIGWVVVGGESGPSARPLNPAWVRNLRDQCVEADVPFLFKQWGEFGEDGKRLGKTKSGKRLDGVQWLQYPKVSNEAEG